MSERSIRFSVLTDDFQRSVTLYRDVLGFPMRPLCNPIAMFSFGAAEFEVCQKECAGDLLGVQPGGPPAGGLLISVEFDEESQITALAKKVLKLGAQRFETTVPADLAFRDFNGIVWMLSVRRTVHSHA